MVPAMTDTAALIIEVMSIHPTPGAGKLVAVASVRLLVEGVELEIHGVQLRADAKGTSAHLPKHRDHTGQWVTSLVLPDELYGAMGDMVIQAGVDLGVVVIKAQD